MRQQEHALRYLEAVIRYLASAGQNVSAECTGDNQGRCAGRRCNDRHNCTGMVAAIAADSFHVENTEEKC